jgi:hypothetical protein
VYARRPQRTADLALAAVRGKTPFEVVVRSAHDPFLEAISLTNGTLSFGPSGRGMSRARLIHLSSANDDRSRFLFVLTTMVPYYV